MDKIHFLSQGRPLAGDCKNYILINVWQIRLAKIVVKYNTDCTTQVAELYFV